MPFTESFAPFLSKDEFATEAVYSTSTVYGIFDLVFTETNGMQNTQPTFFGQASDFLTVVFGTSTILINAVTYLIQEAHPDGTGMTLLVLEKQ